MNRLHATAAFLCIIFLFSLVLAPSGNSNLSAFGQSATPIPSNSPLQASLNPGFLADNFSSDSGMWTYEGSAYRDNASSDVVLTQAIGDQSGAIWLNQPITSNFSASFNYKAGGGSGADGIVMMFYKQENYTKDRGGSLGFNNVGGSSTPGYGIEFDSYQNSGDPSGDHIALIKDSVTNHLNYTNDPRVEDNQLHNVIVNVANSSITCFVDSGSVLNWTGAIDRTNGGFGFSASTGLYTNLQMISNFSITYSPIETNKLNVQVVNSLGTPVNGALITAGTYICYSNALGYASFNLPTGTYKVIATSPNYQLASWTINLDKDRDITLTLPFSYIFAELPDQNIKTQTISTDYNITLLNPSTSSAVSVFFDWQNISTIPAGRNQSFIFDHLPSLIVLAAQVGSLNPNAWYKQPVPITLTPTTGQEGAFIAEPVPYVAGSITTNPKTPSYGDNATIDVTLHNPFNYMLNISRLDFQVSGLNVGGISWTSVGSKSNIPLNANQTEVFSTIWIVNVSGHHCIRVVLTYLSGLSQALQRNLDVENGLLQGETGQVPFLIINPYQITKTLTIKVSQQLPEGWQTSIQINGQDYSTASNITFDLAPGGKFNSVLSIDSGNGQVGQAIVNVEAYIDGQLIGGIQKTMQTVPITPSPTPSPTPTSTVIPTPIFTPTPISTVTPTPVVTPTSTPTPKPTPTTPVNPATSFSIFWITDTQHLSSKDPSKFNDLTDWIVKNARNYNVKMVVHTGDIVDLNKGDSLELAKTEWANANEAMNKLLQWNIPYCWCAGNHDFKTYNDPNSGWLGNNFDGSSNSAFNPENVNGNDGGFFSPGSSAHWVGSTAEGENTAVTFSSNGVNFLIISIEWAAPHNVFNLQTWISNFPSAYSNYQIIIATHAFIDNHGNTKKTTDTKTPYPSDITKTFIDDMNSLLSTYNNIILTLSGHFITDIGNHSSLENGGYNLMFNRQGFDSKDNNPSKSEGESVQATNEYPDGAAAVTILTFDTENHDIEIRTIDLNKNKSNGALLNDIFSFPYPPMQFDYWAGHYTDSTNTVLILPWSTLKIPEFPVQMPGITLVLLISLTGCFAWKLRRRFKL